jgi:hypothetical protein
MSVRSTGQTIHGDVGTGFGQKVAALGDLNDDGYDDFAVSDTGVYIFHGPIEQGSTASSADAFLYFEGAEVLPSVAAAGDVDGDGNQDLLLGTGNTYLDFAGAYIVLGPFDENQEGTQDDVAVLYEGTKQCAGYSIASFPSPSSTTDMGVLLSSYSPVKGRPDTYTICIFHEIPSISTPLEEADAILWQDGDTVPGSSIATGDTNGDGLHDYIVGATGLSNGAVETGGAYLVLGPGDGDLELGEADAILYGENESGWAGDTVADAGDVNGDGYGDVLIGAQLHKNGAAYLMLGPMEGPIQLAEADGRMYSSTTGAHLGVSLDGAGDVNADGFGDIVIGAPEEVGCSGEMGHVLVVLGPIEGSHLPMWPDYTLWGHYGTDCTGSAVAGAGDVDGDGLVDLLVGNPCRSNDDGNVTLVLGANL